VKRGVRNEPDPQTGLYQQEKGGGSASFEGLGGDGRKFTLRPVACLFKFSEKKKDGDMNNTLPCKRGGERRRGSDHFPTISLVRRPVMFIPICQSFTGMEKNRYMRLRRAERENEERKGKTHPLGE